MSTSYLDRNSGYLDRYILSIRTVQHVVRHFLPVPALSIMSCFKWEDGTLFEFNSSSNISPCGPVNATTTAVPCCAYGDACITGGLCFYTYSLTGGSGYYAAGCTDSSFTDTNCRDLCYDQPVPDVTYVSSRGLWACCANTSRGLDCTNPTDETFNLAAPSDLTTYFQIPATGYAYTSASSRATAESAPTGASASGAGTTGSPASTTTSTASGATSPPAPTGSTSNGSLSKGAAAGIGVGAAAAVALAAAATWFALRAWRKSRRSKSTSADGQQVQQVQRESKVDGGNQHTSVYAPAYGNPELSVDRNALEMQA